MDDKIDDKRNDNPDDRQGGGRVAGRILTGLFILGMGTVLLLHQMGFYFPDWFFSWHILLIVFGVFIGIRNHFRGGGWLIMILVGVFFFLQETFPDIPLRRFFWPGILICVGLFIIVRPHHVGGRMGGRRRRDWGCRDDDWKKEKWNKWNNYYSPASDPKTFTSEDFLDSTTLFGSVHRKIVSKNFRGGDVTSMLGGTELDFSQADFQGLVVLDVTQIMGGTKIIVPAHWEVRSEVTAVFGGFEDKRQQPAVTNPDKVLVLRGTSVFGGMELRNF